MRKIQFVRSLWLGAMLGLASAAVAAAAPAPAPAPGMTNTYPPGVSPPVLDEKTVPRVMLTDLLAADIEKTAKYYEDVFGMKIWMRRGNANFASIFLSFPSRETGALTYSGIRIMRDPNYIRNQRLPDLVIVVEDMQPYLRRAEAAGDPVARRQGERGKEHTCFFTDPNGNIIEVVEASLLRTIAPPPAG